MTLHSRWSLMAFIMIVAASGVIVAALAMRADAEADGAGLGSGVEAARFTMTTGPVGDKKQGIFIIDNRTMRLLVYTLEGEPRTLKLTAVRDMTWDARMSHLNNDRPLPDEIRKRVETGAADANNSGE